VRIWGITGTNGKTTTSWMLAEFLKAAYITTVEVNTLSRRFYTGYTTPPLDSLKEIYAEMRSAGAKDCVMEVSSHAIHQNRVGFGETTVFSGGAFTNLSEDHLDYHKTMQEYFKAKFQFAKHLAKGVDRASVNSRKSFPPFVVCLDGGYGYRMLELAGRLPLNVIPVSVKNPRFDLSNFKIPGEFNKSNVLVAASLAEAAGIKHDVIQQMIPLLKPRWGRLEKVDNPKVRAEVYVDFAHTPDGIEKVLAAAKKFTKGKLWVVFGAGGNRDRLKRPLMGEAASKFADEIILTSDNPRNENPFEIISEIRQGVYSSSHCTEIQDRSEAIAYALANADKDDVILICGKGHETTQEISGVKYPFSDKDQILSFV
jgi:UDP-N-acetylmuramoyl-L-alanyl-D-glutamate--2,6-diaminopimelate ligase